MLESKVKNRDQLHKNLQEKIKELEGQLDQKASLHNQSERQVLQLSSKLKGKEEIYSTLQEKVRDPYFNERYFFFFFFFFFDRQLLLLFKVKELESKVRDHERDLSESLSLQQKVCKIFR